MQIEEFLEESADLLQWLDDSDTTLHTKDPSAADEDSLVELIEKIKVCMTAVIPFYSPPASPPPPPQEKKTCHDRKSTEIMYV